ncbi:origin recognition complex subunit 5 [Paragonimus westermani]|uniref:Origin recognition complex subunit 5 n=1 Tax=Paragonimus westermani TaxID=34504 RepID=A0A5J4P518_9TREM|nr:origin recognition complex subunit 5 [Paragonimus westermani]
MPTSSYTHIFGRSDEQQTLIALLGQNDPITPCIVINGPSGCGKSLLLSTTLNDLERLCNQRWILISCLEGCSSASHSALSSTTPKPLFELILQSIRSKYASHFPISECRCDGAASFVVSLCSLLKALATNKPTSLVIVFDQAEKLRDAGPLLLPLIVRLGSLVGEQLHRTGSVAHHSRVVSILVTRSPWEKFSSGTFHLEPVVVPVNSYSRDQMTQILHSLQPHDASQTRFRRFVDLLLTVCFPVCRNAGELIHLTKINWLAFEEPVVKGVIAPDDEWGQWKFAQPTLKRSLSNLYLRQQASAGAVNATVTSLELPYFTRFMLIAAFLASYNPREADKKFLVKTKALLLGPRVFPVDRLLAIFHALLRNESEPVPHTSLLISQIASLTALGLLSATSPANVIGGLHTLGANMGSSSFCELDALANPRYRCMLSLETVKAVAQSVDFDLTAYLADFSGVC